MREFKLEKIKLAMDFPRRVWFRGEKIEATLQTAYYWGEPLANRVLRCTLPDRRIERVTTDAEGKAKLTFDTTGMTPGQPARLHRRARWRQCHRHRIAHARPPRVLPSPPSPASRWSSPASRSISI